MVGGDKFGVRRTVYHFRKDVFHTYVRHRHSITFVLVLVLALTPALQHYSTTLQAPSPVRCFFPFRHEKKELRNTKIIETARNGQSRGLNPLHPKNISEHLEK